MKHDGCWDKKGLIVKQKVQVYFLTSSCPSRYTFWVKRQLSRLFHALACYQRCCDVRKFPLCMTERRYAVYCSCFCS